MIVVVRLIDGTFRNHSNVERVYIEKSLPNVLQIRCVNSALFYNMDSVEYYEAIYKDDDKCES